LNEVSADADSDIALTARAIRFGNQRVTPRRRTRRIAWNEVVRATLPTFPHALRVWSRTERIGLSDCLIGYGRAANLIATRIPPGIVTNTSTPS
jgi:hypothetical protein